MIKHVYILLSSLDSGVWKPVSCFSAVSLSHCHLYLGAVEHYCRSYKRLMGLSSRKPCNGALQYFFKEMVACRIVYVNWSDKLLGVMAMAERFRSSNSNSGGSVIVVCVWNPVMTLVSLSKMFRARCSKNGYLWGLRVILCLEEPLERHGPGCILPRELRNFAGMLLAWWPAADFTKR